MDYVVIGLNVSRALRWLAVTTARSTSKKFLSDTTDPVASALFRIPRTNSRFGISATMTKSASPSQKNTR